MAITKNTAVFVKEGKTMDYTTASNETIACGTVKIVAGCLCLALWDIPASTEASLHICHKGEVIKITADDVIGQTNAGVAIYLDANGLVTKTSTSATLIGYTRAAVAATDKSFEIICA